MQIQEKSFFTDHSRTFLLISTAIVLVAIILTVFGLGMNMGIDFTGGSLLHYQVGQDFEAADIEAALTELNVSEYQVAKVGNENPRTEVQIRVKLLENSDDFRTDLEKALAEKYPDLTFITIDHVGAVAGQDLIMNAIKSVLIVFACLLIYIAIRFDFYSGLAALCALVHDVLIMCAFMVFFRSFFQVNSSFIAALLTIIGYSINNTIVIFDRIREVNKIAEYRNGPKKTVVEVSVRQTISRTINTTITTLLTLVTLYIVGVDAIREFAFPLIIGMLAGVYSSVLISGQLWATWLDRNSFGKLKAVFKKG